MSVQQQVDFKGLAEVLRSRAREYIPAWLPGGTMRGKEYCCGSIRGEKGESFRVNVETGKWADFATDEKGGDLISLYAAIQSIDQVQSARELSEKIGFTYSTEKRPAPKLKEVILPPKDFDRPPSFATSMGEPTGVWTYRTAKGRVMFYVARYETKDKKQFLPWTYDSDGVWANKGWGDSRPLYGLEFLSADPKRPVLIVEGEKACDAARRLMGERYFVVTWPNGAKAISKADFRPIYGRDVLLWPDADQKKIKTEIEAAKFGNEIGALIPYQFQPGVAAMLEIAKALYPHCPSIKILDVSKIAVDGWDAADCEWDWSIFSKWAKSVVQVLKPIPITDTPLEIPAPKPEQDDATLAYLSAPVEKKSIAESPDLSTSVSFYALWESLGIPTNRNGEVPNNLSTFMKVIRGHKPLKNVIWFDEFYQKYLTMLGCDEPREWTEIDELDLLIYFQENIGFKKANHELVKQCTRVYAHKNIRNAPKDWMNSLLWDRVPRVESFFHDCFGVEQTAYTWAVSKNFWVSMAARIFDPGCMAKNMVVLEGVQDASKSTALRVIGGKWYVEAGNNILNKDFFLIMQGKLIVEVGEMSAFNRADKDQVKQVISCPTDTFRPPYGERPQDFPRRCIFVGTTNKDDYLDDETGAVRFWPIRIVSIDIERIKRDREQLFAEACELFKSGATWHEVPKEDAAFEQESRRQHDVWEDKIAEFIDGRPEVSSLEILTSSACINKKLSEITQWDKIRVSKAMTVLGWNQTRKRASSGKTARTWVKD